MSRRCEVCGRGPTKGASRSHSKIKTLKRQYINLQKVGKKKVCTKCIRTTTKQTKATT
ncbi:MAG: bL28 family ribosomal protein [Patescibacteria group bacterium]